MNKIKEEIKSEFKDFTPGNKVEERSHPSFGQFAISRQTSGRGDVLYGSSIKSHNLISIRVYPSKHMIDGSHEWYFATHAPIVEVIMTPTQFAEAITTLNCGDGVPCTIVRKEDDAIEVPDFENKKVIHSRNFKERMSEYGEALEKLRKEAKEFLNDSKPKSVKARTEFLQRLDYALVELKSNIPYFEEQFLEQMDKTVMEAKGEVDAFVTSKIQKLGMEALAGKKLVEIEEGEKK